MCEFSKNVVRFLVSLGMTSSHNRSKWGFFDDISYWLFILILESRGNVWHLQSSKGDSIYYTMEMFCIWSHLTIGISTEIFRIHLNVSYALYVFDNVLTFMWCSHFITHRETERRRERVSSFEFPIDMPNWRHIDALPHLETMCAE